MVISQTKRQIVAKEHLSWKKHRNRLGLGVVTLKSNTCLSNPTKDTKDTKDTIRSCSASKTIQLVGSPCPSASFHWFSAPFCPLTMHTLKERMSLDLEMVSHFGVYCRRLKKTYFGFFLKWGYPILKKQMMWGYPYFKESHTWGIQ